MDGKTPKLIVLPDCQCKDTFSSYIQKKIQTTQEDKNESESSPLDHMICKCLEDNMEKALKTSLCDLFSKDHTLTLKEVVKNEFAKQRHHISIITIEIRCQEDSIVKVLFSIT